MQQRIVITLSTLLLAVMVAGCGAETAPGGANEPPDVGTEEVEEDGEIAEDVAGQDVPAATNGGASDGAATATPPVVTQPPAATAEPATPSPTATETAPVPAAVRLERVAEGMAAPVVFKPVPDGSGRHVVVDQVGLVYVLDAEENLLDEPFLDLRASLVPLNQGFDERGLLGLAFHPDYAQNGYFFVYYSAPLRRGGTGDHTSHISRFEVSSADANRADRDSEQIILQVDQPQGNHNGGQIAFGPDGYLYIALGDGGAANDVGGGHVSDWYAANQGGNGQDVAQNLLGSILRIDVDGESEGRPYGIPADNPFVGQPEALPEIWAYGLRNPFRFSFDMVSGALFAGDVGQGRWEEVDIIEAGGNYGWNVREGSHCFMAPNCPESDPEGDPLIPPILEYPNANQAGGLGLAVIGGYVYHGNALPGLRGVYVFGDWSDRFGPGNGRLLIGVPAEGGGWEMRDLPVAGSTDGTLDSFLLSFGQDVEGEVYVLTSEATGPTGSSGRVYRLAAP
ncbi:MAG: PQQ-dependent sugar dehydrogenase [Candidatus Promineifilaceae bacterium]|nr:PQQ-dependent sugar dehydrogenase [Candidatus Promineifilaceae bacterium]